MNPRDLRYGYYGRKSSESDERQIQSLDDQERWCERMAAGAGLNIAKRYSEAKSAKAPGERVQFNALLRDLRSGVVNGIICWKLDRLARNPDEAGAIIGMLQRGEIRHIKTSERDYWSEDNALITYMEFGIANQMVRDLSKNVKRGLDSKVEKGWMPGRAPQGYLNSKLNERGANYILVDEERFPLIERAWRLMLTGDYLPRHILQLLNEEWGYRTRLTRHTGGMPLALSALYRIFTNPFYAGVISYGGRYEVGQHRPMITMAEFDRVQALLGRPGKPHRIYHEYAFTGMIRCGECGRLISATRKEKRLKSGDTKLYVLYYCIGARSGDCSQYYTNVDSIETQIGKKLALVAMEPKIRDWALQFLERNQQGDRAAHMAIRSSRESALAQAERQLGVLTDLRLREQIDDTEFQSRRPQLRAEIARLRAQSAEAITEHDWVPLVARTFDFAFHALVRFVDGELPAKRETLTEFSWNRSLRDGKLSIEAIPRYLELQKRLPTLRRKMRAVELEENGSDKSSNEPPAALVPTLCALVEAVGTAAREEIAKKQSEGI
ncbi:recombinase family protein [Sphingomonas sp.]|uniref:recombinase family protein n=1 Tax=Sphingomonas sp. TaxID=28214 RepID=UPI001B0060CF|nr:recombinase family protein [Sphingomonas sp.]MBO9714258.1 recombinase family protein [Sphingomonas sp.]